jgi:catalase
MTDQDRDNPVGNIVDHPSAALKRIQYRRAAIFYKADLDYGKRGADGLGLDTKKVERLAEMSKEKRAEAAKNGSY